MLTRHRIVLAQLQLFRGFPRAFLGHIEEAGIRRAHHADQDDARFGHGIGSVLMPALAFAGTLQPRGGTSSPAPPQRLVAISATESLSAWSLIELSPSTPPAGT